MTTPTRFRFDKLMIWALVQLGQVCKSAGRVKMNSSIHDTRVMLAACIEVIDQGPINLR